MAAAMVVIVLMNGATAHRPLKIVDQHLSSNGRKLAQLASSAPPSPNPPSPGVSLLAHNLAYGAAWTCSGTWGGSPNADPGVMLRFENAVQITNYTMQCSCAGGHCDGAPAAVMHSGCFDTMPSVTIDMGAPTAVSSVAIYNRADCCQDRFAQFRILLGNSAPPNAAWGQVSTGNSSTWTNSPLSFNPICYIQNSTLNMGDVGAFPCVGTGRYLTLQQTSRRYDGDTCMNLCALFVYSPPLPKHISPPPRLAPPSPHPPRPPPPSPSPPPPAASVALCAALSAGTAASAVYSTHASLTLGSVKKVCKSHSHIASLYQH